MENKIENTILSGPHASVERSTDVRSPPLSPLGTRQSEGRFVFLALPNYQRAMHHFRRVRQIHFTASGLLKRSVLRSVLKILANATTRCVTSKKNVENRVRPVTPMGIGRMAWKGLRSFIHQQEHPAQPSFPNLDIIQYEIMGVTLETVKKPPFLGQPGQGRATGWAWLEGRDTGQTWGRQRGAGFLRDGLAV